MKLWAWLLVAQAVTLFLSLRRVTKMEDKEILDGQLGSAVSYDIEFKGGKLSGSIVNPQTGISVKLEIPARAVLEALKKAVPGTIDDAIINVVEAALAL